MPRTREQVEQAARAARVVQQSRAAERALKDPRKLAAAIRITRAAIDNEVVSIDVLTGEADDLVDLGVRIGEAEVRRGA